jgi:hypothetical protein
MGDLYTVATVQSDLEKGLLHTSDGVKRIDAIAIMYFDGYKEDWMTPSPQKDQDHLDNGQIRIQPGSGYIHFSKIEYVSDVNWVSRALNAFFQGVVLPGKHNAPQHPRHP